MENPILMAPMPTASTSQILGYNECIEPITSNIYSRRTLAGEFVLVNKYLMQEMLEQDRWNETFKNQMVANCSKQKTYKYGQEHTCSGNSPWGADGSWKERGWDGRDDNDAGAHDGKT